LGNWLKIGVLVVCLIPLFTVPIFAQEERLGLTEDEFEDVFVSSEEYTKLMDRLYKLENQTHIHPYPVIDYFVECSTIACDLTNISAVLLAVLIGGLVAAYFHHIQTSQAKLRKNLAHDDLLFEIMGLKRANLSLRNFIEYYEKKYHQLPSKEKLSFHYDNIKYHNSNVKKSISSHRYDADIIVIQSAEFINYDGNLIVEAFPPDKEVINSLDEKIQSLISLELNESYKKLDDIDHDFFKSTEYT